MDKVIAKQVAGDSAATVDCTITWKCLFSMHPTRWAAVPAHNPIELKLFESKANSDTSVSIAAYPSAIVFDRWLAQDKLQAKLKHLGDNKFELIDVQEIPATKE
ncbi:hypothetical protein [Nitrosomonas oligotropha]|nr:hypothetical protein [Nitrosomonas oligotropha]